jgi:hypothetical protein
MARLDLMGYWGIAMGLTFLGAAVLVLVGVGFDLVLFPLLLTGLAGLGSGLTLIEWSKGN